MGSVPNYPKPVSLCPFVVVVALLVSATGAMAGQAGKSPIVCEEKLVQASWTIHLAKG